MNKLHKKLTTWEVPMRKITISLFFLFFVLLSTGLIFSLQNKEDEKFQKSLDSYFDGLWKFYPTFATSAGYHKYDNKLEDMSKKNIEKRHEALDAFNKDFVANLDSMALSPELQIDHSMIIEAIDGEATKHENLLPWEYNPLFYNKIFNNCIKSLLTKEFAPLEERAKNAVERLKNLPKLIKQAKENLKTPAQIYTETAIKQFPAILDFYKTQLPALIEQAPASQKAKLQEKLAKATPELEAYQTFLTNDLLPRSTGTFRLGTAHRRMVRINFQNNIPIEELLARAQADYKNIRREMFLVCIPFYKIMDPVINIESPPANLTEDQLFNTTILHVLNKIKENHVSKDEYLDKIKSLVQEMKEFLPANEMMDLNGGDLNIEAMPQDIQGKSRVKLEMPGIYETSGTYSCLISQFPDDLGNDKIESLLEEQNNFLLPFWVIRNIYPGEFVPYFATNKNPSLVRKLYSNLPLIKGWAIMLEERLIMAKYGNYDLRMRLNQLKFRLKAPIDFILDFNIHEGSMEKKDAIAYMMRGGFQTEAEAEKNWDRILLNPGEAAYTYVGMQELLDMEKEYKQLKGDSFSQKDFLKEVLEHGAIPLRFLKNKIIQ